MAEKRKQTPPDRAARVQAMRAQAAKPTTQKVEEAKVVVTGRMSTEDFVIRVLIVAAVVAGLYYFFSPYQNCLRRGGGQLFGGVERSLANVCEHDTSW